MMWSRATPSIINQRGSPVFKVNLALPYYSPPQNPFQYGSDAPARPNASSTRIRPQSARPTTPAPPTASSRSWPHDRPTTQQPSDTDLRRPDGRPAPSRALRTRTRETACPETDRQDGSGRRRGDRAQRSRLRRASRNGAAVRRRDNEETAGHPGCRQSKRQGVCGKSLGLVWSGLVFY